MRHICIHGHFYQPPRENPWLEAIEPQDSAAPYHDWNERVSAECYEPNTAARILDDRDQIVGIVNNYGRMSFDFGPTLLSWMETAQPSVYRAILRADRKSRKRYSGHGSAMAQAYHHTILPLATTESKRLQVSWGARDFERRFERPAEGMWLPETAVDLETLECLVDVGIRFTVLAPSQAHRVRPIGGSDWSDVSGGRVDPSVAYEQRLPSGRTIAIFFYDGVLSRGVAFDGLLHRGEVFADRLASAAPDEEGRLAHIATDGESYGHHHAHGDMALAFAMDAIGHRDDQTLTNYGEFLERFPPRSEVEIFERSSWSCAHGVERWRSDCGCHTGGPPGWNQAWRAPLRGALDWLYERALSLFKERARETFPDPATAVEDYVTPMTDRRDATVARFLLEHAPESTSASGLEGGVNALKLLELRRQLELMYTSCGWFFNDLAGLETVQILRYAGRAVQLTEDLSGMNVESQFLELLERAHSNRFEKGTGRDIYEREVRPAKVTWEMLAAHYAIDAFFGTGPSKTSIYCHDVTGASSDVSSAGDARVMSGTASMISTVTRSSENLSFVVFHPGGPRVLAGIRRGTKPADDIVREILDAAGAEAAAKLREHFGRHVYTLDSLFGDERRRIVDSLLGATLAEAEESHRQVAKKHGPTIRFLTELGVPVPAAFSAAAAIVANGDLKRAVDEDPLDPGRIRDAVGRANGYGVALDSAELSYRFEKALLQSATRFFERPDDLDQLQRLVESVALATTAPFDVQLWKIQNLYLRAIRDRELGTHGSDAWREQFRRLGESLSIRQPADAAS